MKTLITYPVPMDTPEVWETFKPFVMRFAKTFAEFVPGVHDDYWRLALVFTKSFSFKLTQEVGNWFAGIPNLLFSYGGDGCDLGAQQHLADAGDHFQINFTTRMYFHRAGWLAHLLEARGFHGPALYGLTASHEGGRLHLCTRGHCFDSADFRKYPHRIMSRDQGVFVECGDGCLLDFFEQQLKREAFLVTWNGVYRKPDWFNIPNRFRNGDQSNVLIWDKHTEVWANAGPEERERLTKLSEPPSLT